MEYNGTNLDSEDLLYLYNDVLEGGDEMLIAKTCPAGYSNYYGQCCKGQGLNNMTCI